MHCGVARAGGGKHRRRAIWIKGEKQHGNQILHQLRAYDSARRVPVTRAANAANARRRAQSAAAVQRGQYSEKDWLVTLLFSIFLRLSRHPPLLCRQDRHGHPLAAHGGLLRHRRAGGHHHDRDGELYGRQQPPDRAGFAQESRATVMRMLQAAAQAGQKPRVKKRSISSKNSPNCAIPA